MAIPFIGFLVDPLPFIGIGHRYPLFANNGRRRCSYEFQVATVLKDSPIPLYFTTGWLGYVSSLPMSAQVSLIPICSIIGKGPLKGGAIINLIKMHFQFFFYTFSKKCKKSSEKNHPCGYTLARVFKRRRRRTLTKQSLDSPMLNVTS